jgi:hypothetical protein
LQHWQALVLIAQPKTAGWDFNDILVREGLLAVKTELQQAISYAEYQGKASIEIKTNIRKERSVNMEENPLPIKETAKIERSFELEI